MFLFIGSGTVWSKITQKFKYISCSYLSDSGNYDRVSDAVFKYISCSYLSEAMQDGLVEGYHLNTSHVLIYRFL